jgi:hypothetical protein
MKPTMKLLIALLLVLAMPGLALAQQAQVEPVSTDYQIYLTKLSFLMADTIASSSYPYHGVVSYFTCYIRDSSGTHETSERRLIRLRL